MKRSTLGLLVTLAFIIASPPPLKAQDAASGVQCNFCTEFVLDVMWGQVAYHKFKNGNNPNMVDASSEPDFSEPDFVDEEEFLATPGVSESAPGYYWGDHRKLKLNKCNLTHLTCSPTEARSFRQIKAALLSGRLSVRSPTLRLDDGNVAVVNKDRRAVQIYGCRGTLIAHIQIEYFFSSDFEKMYEK